MSNMGFGLTLDLIITHVQKKTYGATVLRTMVKAADRLGLYDILEQWASAGRYKCGADWLLCRLYPGEEAACRAYYAGKGKSFAKLHTRAEVRHIDRMLAQTLGAAVAKVGRSAEESTDVQVLR